MASSKARVLIVDDEPDIRAMLSEYLTGLGYEVLVAGTAPGARGIVRTNATDVVLIDVKMPGALDGDAMITTFARDVPVIVMTGLADLQLALDTIRRGAFDFVMKPFTFSRVSDVVDAALAAGRSTHET